MTDEKQRLKRLEQNVDHSVHDIEHAAASRLQAIRAENPEKFKTVGDKPAN